jgi:hypothetical protein
MVIGYHDAWFWKKILKNEINRPEGGIEPLHDHFDYRYEPLTLSIPEQSCTCINRSTPEQQKMQKFSFAYCSL